MFKIRVKALTLLECLVALLVLVGSLTLYQGLTKVLFAHSHYLSDNSREHWLVFCQQFRTELAGSELVRLEENRLYVRKKDQELAFGKFRADDFRKTNGAGLGYQPMLFGVESAVFSQEGEVMILEVRLENGLERSFVYAFETAD